MYVRTCVHAKCMSVCVSVIPVMFLVTLPQFYSFEPHSPVYVVSHTTTRTMSNAISRVLLSYGCSAKLILPEVQKLPEDQKRHWLSSTFQPLFVNVAQRAWSQSLGQHATTFHWFTNFHSTMMKNTHICEGRKGACPPPPLPLLDTLRTWS